MNYSRLSSTLLLVLLLSRPVLGAQTVTVYQNSTKTSSVMELFTKRPWYSIATGVAIGATVGLASAYAEHRTTYNFSTNLQSVFNWAASHSLRRYGCYLVQRHYGNSINGNLQNEYSCAASWVCWLFYLIHLNRQAALNG